MKAMDHGAATDSVEREGASSAPSHRCAECLTPLTGNQPNMLFCCPAHRVTFHDRMKIRGRQLAPLEMAVMVTRHGRRGDKEAGVKAARSAQRLKRQWIAEDRAITEDRPAGRMPMDQYIRRLMRHHDLP